MGAEKYLNDKIELLGSLITTPHIRYKDGGITRELIDFKKALQTVRKYVKRVKSELEIDPIPYIIQYLKDPND